MCLGLFFSSFLSSCSCSPRSHAAAPPQCGQVLERRYACSGRRAPGSWASRPFIIPLHLPGTGMNKLYQLQPLLSKRIHFPSCRPSGDSPVLASITRTQVPFGFPHFFSHENQQHTALVTAGGWSSPTYRLRFLRPLVASLCKCCPWVFGFASHCSASFYKQLKSSRNYCCCHHHHFPSVIKSIYFN